MDNYIDFVCNEARKINKIFIMDTGEGRETFDKNLDVYIEDLSGWLIPVELKDDAISTRKNEESMEEFDEYYCFAKWFYDFESKLKVKFKSSQEC